MPTAQIDQNNNSTVDFEAQVFSPLLSAENTVSDLNTQNPKNKKFTLGHLLSFFLEGVAPILVGAAATSTVSVLSILCSYTFSEQNPALMGEEVRNCAVGGALAGGGTWLTIHLLLAFNKIDLENGSMCHSFLLVLGIALPFIFSPNLGQLTLGKEQDGYQTLFHAAGFVIFSSIFFVLEGICVLLGKSILNLISRFLGVNAILVQMPLDSNPNNFSAGQRDAIVIDVDLKKTFSSDVDRALSTASFATQFGAEREDEQNHQNDENSPSL